MAYSTLQIYIDGDLVIIYYNDFQQSWGGCMELTQNITTGFSVSEDNCILYKTKFLVKEGSTEYITTSDYVYFGDRYQTVEPMKHGAYIGVSGVARKIKKIYVGVNGIARKVKKAYIGVGGVARLCFSGGGEVVYSGELTPYPKTTSYVSAVNFNKKLLCVGGVSPLNTVIYGYSNSLTLEEMIPKLSVERYKTINISTENHCFISGGNRSGSIMSNALDVLDVSFVATASELSTAKSDHAAVRVGNYVLFCGGYINSSKMTNTIDCFDDSSLVRTNPFTLNTAGACFGASLEECAILSEWISSGVYHCYRIDSSLTHTFQTLDKGGAMNTLGRYAVIRCNNSNTIIAVDSSFTLLNMPESSFTFSNTRNNVTNVLEGNLMITNGQVSTSVESYDELFTKKMLQDAPYTKNRCATGVVGDYALFIAGISTTSSSSYTNTVFHYGIL